MAQVYETIAELMEATGMNEEQAKSIGYGIKIPKLAHRWRLSGTNVMDDFNLYLQVKSCERPVATFDEIEIPPNCEANPSPHARYVAGRMSWSTIAIVLEDDARGDAARVIQKQFQKQMEDNFDDYKFDLTVEYLDGNGDVDDKWVMQGCFIQTVNYTSLDYSSSEAVEMEVIVRYDNALML